MTQMSAQVFFVVAAVKNAVTVPVAALHQPGAHAAKGEVDPDMAHLSAGTTGDELGAIAASDEGSDVKPYYVRVLGADGHATRRQVWIGISNRVSAEVLEGLQPGDVVIVGRQIGGQTADATPSGARANRSGMGRLF
jgi:macrolide-specific efflux system membrane fusion protein